MVIFGVLTSWVGQRTPQTIDHRWSMLLHTFKSPATDQTWLFSACRIFFFNLIKLYQEFLQRAIRFRPISNSKIPHIWCIVGLKRGKINALWDTFYYIQHCMDLQLAVDPYKRHLLFESMDWLPKTHKVSWHISANQISTKHSPTVALWYEKWGLQFSQKSDIW